MPDYSVTKAAMLSFSRLVADLYAKDGIRCNAVTPGPTATEAWLAEGGLADQQGDARRGAREGRRRPTARPARAAGRDRRGDRLPLLRPRELRHRRRLERRRRHRPDHHLTLRPARRCAGGDDTLAGVPQASARSSAFVRRTVARPRGDCALAARRALLRDARPRCGRRRSPTSARRSSATATGSSTRSRSGG